MRGPQPRADNVIFSGSVARCSSAGQTVVDGFAETCFGYGRNGNPCGTGGIEAGEVRKKIAGRLAQIA